ncbi:hypothetical protein KBB12_01625 [Candidatus Woesebacteria bacterium]|nr:hypothetical protein [Candidatus Woesebacteria bacterium]
METKTVKWFCFVGRRRVGTYECRADVAQELVIHKVIWVANKGFDITDIDVEERKLSGVWA